MVQINGKSFFWGIYLDHYSPFNAGGVPWELKKREWDLFGL
jgi:hypothetical protein